ncbi:hypothetical protein SLA2020_256230 [Shorea laevis]
MLGMLHTAELDLRKSQYSPDLLVNQTKGRSKLWPGPRPSLRQLRSPTRHLKQRRVLLCQEYACIAETIISRIPGCGGQHI